MARRVIRLNSFLPFTKIGVQITLFGPQLPTCRPIKAKYGQHVPLLRHVRIECDCSKLAYVGKVFLDSLRTFTLNPKKLWGPSSPLGQEGVLQGSRLLLSSGRHLPKMNSSSPRVLPQITRVHTGTEARTPSRWHVPITRFRLKVGQQ